MLQVLRLAFKEDAPGEDAVQVTVPRAGDHHTAAGTLAVPTLRSLDGVQGFHRLRTLRVNHHALSTCEHLAGLVTLTDLNLSHNQLRSCDHLQHLTALQNLNLSSNYLSRVAPLGHLTSLRHINIADNSITSLQALQALSPLLSVLTLRCSGNSAASHAQYTDTITTTLPNLRVLDGSLLRSRRALTPVISMTPPVPPRPPPATTPDLRLTVDVGAVLGGSLPSSSLLAELSAEEGRLRADVRQWEDTIDMHTGNEQRSTTEFWAAFSALKAVAAELDSMGLATQASPRRQSSGGGSGAGLRLTHALIRRRQEVLSAWVGALEASRVATSAVLGHRTNVLVMGTTDGLGNSDSLESGYAAAIKAEGHAFVTARAVLELSTDLSPPEGTVPPATPPDSGIGELTRRLHVLATHKALADAQLRDCEAQLDAVSARMREADMYTAGGDSPQPDTQDTTFEAALADPILHLKLSHAVPADVAESYERLHARCMTTAAALRRHKEAKVAATASATRMALRLYQVITSHMTAQYMVLEAKTAKIAPGDVSAALQEKQQLIDDLTVVIGSLTANGGSLTLQAGAGGCSVPPGPPPSVPAPTLVEFCGPPPGRGLAPARQAFDAPRVVAPVKPPLASSRSSSPASVPVSRRLQLSVASAPSTPASVTPRGASPPPPTTQGFHGVCRLFLLHKEASPQFLDAGKLTVRPEDGDVGFVALKGGRVVAGALIADPPPVQTSRTVVDASLCVRPAGSPRLYSFRFTSASSASGLMKALDAMDGVEAPSSTKARGGWGGERPPHTSPPRRRPSPTRPRPRPTPRAAAAARVARRVSPTPRPQLRRASPPRTTRASSSPARKHMFSGSPSTARQPPSRSLPRPARRGVALWGTNTAPARQQPQAAAMAASAKWRQAVARGMVASSSRR